MTISQNTHGGARPGTGRPLGSASLRSRAARHVDAAVAALADVAGDPAAPAAARVDAAVALLDAARPPAKT